MKKRIIRLLLLLENQNITFFFSCVGVLFGVATVLRIFEGFLFEFSHHLLESMVRYEILGLIYDYIFVFCISTILLFVMYGIVFFCKRKKKHIFLFITISYFILTVLFIQYYIFGLVPLDDTLFNYSLSEIYHIVTASFECNFAFFVGLLLLIFVISVIVYIYRKIPNKKIACFGFVLYCISVVLIVYRGEFAPSSDHFATGIQYNTSINKTAYFLSRLCAPSKFNERDTMLTIFDIRTIQQQYRGAKFVNDSFPFLRDRDTSSTLSTFFTLKEKKPNIVLIITEGLSGSLCGLSDSLSSCTPFLDSLCANGLYWSNCISTSERTFNALPAIIGSLPLTKNFMALGGDMPYHKSLASVLKNANYQTSFFYGGDLTFDAMNMFIEYQKFTLIEGGAWGKMDDGTATLGVEDVFMFNNAVKKLKNMNSLSRLDVYLTLSIHEPYSYTTRSNYFSRVMRNNRSERKSFLELKAAMLYDDDAFRQLFKAYKKLPDFDNTIFIITGDHSHSIVASVSDIEKYHVPLIIYSPLLKRHKQSKAIVSHLDITPSILQLLVDKYKISYDKKIHWLGSQLDTATQFRSNKEQAFLNIRREIDDYLLDTIFYSNGRLYRVTDNLKLHLIHDKKMSQQFEQKLSIVRKVNHYVCKQNRVTPHSSKVEILWQIGTLSDSTLFMKEFIDLPFVPLTGKGGEYKITLKGELFIADTAHCPFVVLHPFDGKRNVICNHIGTFHSIDWLPILPNTWQLVQVSHVLKLNEGQGIGGDLYSFLWNPYKVAVKYRNMVITITRQ